MNFKCPLGDHVAGDFDRLAGRRHGWFGDRGVAYGGAHSGNFGCGLLGNRFNLPGDFLAGDFDLVFHIIAAVLPNIPKTIF